MKLPLRLTLFCTCTLLFLCAVPLRNALAQEASVSRENRDKQVDTPMLLAEIKGGAYRGTTPIMFRWELLSMNKLLLSDWAKVRRYVFRHPEFFWSSDNKSGILSPDKGSTLSIEEKEALAQMETACEYQLARQDIFMGDMTFRSPIKTTGLNEPLSSKNSRSQPTRMFPSQPQQDDTAPQKDSSAQTAAEPLVQTLDDPRTGNSELEWARAQMDAKDYKGAAESATKALESNPKLVEAYRLRAAAYAYAGNQEGALKDAAAALSLNPNDAALYSIRAWLLNDMGNHLAAYEDMSRAIALEPKAASAYYNRAVILEQMGKYKQMFEDMAMAVNLDPTRYAPKESQAREKYNDLVKRGDIPDAELPPPGTKALSMSRERLFSLLRFALLLAGGVIGFLILKKLLQTLGEKRKQEKIGPDMLAHFQIEKQLGEGGMGVVYEATDRILKRKVAIKKLRAELVRDDTREELMQEARTVASLHHPNIVEIYTVLEDKKDLYLVFEYVHGQTLDQRINSDGAFSLKEAKPVFGHICKALEYAHAHNVIHRDLKPSNIMITETNAIKVMDFGVARQVEGPRQGKLVAGTPAYMAPEQNRGIIRKESDVYSLGICFYEAVVGHVPWEIQGYVPGSGKIVPVSQVVKTLPKEIDQLMEMALQPDPDQRMRNASHFWKVLNSIPDA